MGWQYTEGVDWSDYKYLVVKLSREQKCNAHLNIFTANSIWGNCHETSSFGKEKQIVVKLQEARYTSDDKAGQPLDLKNIHIVSFWGNGSGTIVIDEMYLTNNDDYSREETPNSIEFAETVPGKVDVYGVNGICMRKQVSSHNALQSLVYKKDMCFSVWKLIPILMREEILAKKKKGVVE